MQSHSHKPFFSVIIPAFNEESYIVNCIRSIKNQKSDVPFEVIVVDNDSTDTTHKLARAEGAIVCSEKTPGCAAARNQGAKVASGSILVFVDADSKLPQNYLKNLTMLLMENPSVVAFSGPCIYYDGGPLLYLLTNTLKYFKWYFRLIKNLFGLQCFSGANLAIKRKILKQLGGFNENIRSILEPEDLDFAIHLHQANYKLLFSDNLKIYVSSRRVKRSPFKDTLIRSKNSLKLLLSYKIGFSLNRFNA